MRPRRKKSTIRFLAFLMAFLLCGCASLMPRKFINTPAQEEKPAPVNSPAPASTPVPTPAPVRIPAVLFLADCEKEQAQHYINSLMLALQGQNWYLVECYSPEGYPEAIPANAYDGVLVLRTQADTSLAPVKRFITQDTPVSIVDLFPEGQAPEHASYFWYEQEDVEAYALDVALNYPPHDAPVRMLALFTEKGSTGHEAFFAAVEEGKILPKGTFYAGKKPQRAKEFVEEQLDEYVEGTIDAVYAETLPLALAALMALTEHGRTDMEVFAVPQGSIYLQQQLLEQYLFPVAMGADPAAWASLQVTALNAMMRGGAPIKSAFRTSIVYAKTE